MVNMPIVNIIINIIINVWRIGCGLDSQPLGWGFETLAVQIACVLRQDTLPTFVSLHPGV